MANPGQTPVAGKGEVSIRTDDKAVFETPIKPFTVPPGAAEAIAAEHALSAPACGDVAVSITDQAGEPWLAYTLPFVYSRELAFKVRYYPTPARLEAVIDAGSSAMLAHITGAKVSIVPAGGTNVLHATAIAKFDGLQQEVKIDCGPLPVGAYDVLAEVKLGDTTATLKERLVKEPPPEWLGNKLGTIETVPKPWTPLTLTERTVACWGREYTFGAAALPAQVRVLGQDLLAGPARLLVTAGGQTQSVPLGEFTSRGDHSAQSRLHHRRARGEPGGVRQGVDRVRRLLPQHHTLSSAQPVQVEGLAIEIPIKPEFATLLVAGRILPRATRPKPEGETRIRGPPRHAHRRRGTRPAVLAT